MTLQTLQLPLIFIPAPVGVPLTHGQVAIIDAHLADWLLTHRWRALRNCRTWYALRTANRHQVLYMHRMIWEQEHGPIPEGLRVDHVNRDGLDNRLINLRLATPAQNCANARTRQGCSSRYKGVGWNKSAGAWRARIYYRRREYVLGRFEREEEAARAYDAAAVAVYGPYARLNFPAERSRYEGEAARSHPVLQRIRALL